MRWPPERKRRQLLDGKSYSKGLITTHIRNERVNNRKPIGHVSTMPESATSSGIKKGVGREVGAELDIEARANIIGFARPIGCSSRVDRTPRYAF